MKNLKVSLKLIISFLIVVAMAVAVGGIGIYGMYSINAADDELYNGNYLPTVLAGDISQNIVEQRVYIRNYVIYDVNADADLFASAEKNMTTTQNNMTTLLSEYKGTIVNSEDQEAYDEFVKVYNEQWLPAVTNIHQLGVNNQVADAKEALTNSSNIAASLNTLTSKLQDINLKDGETAVHGNTTLFTTMAIVEVGVLLAAVAISLFLAFYISNLISKPVNFMRDVLLRIGTKGELLFSDSEYRQIEDYATVKDEVGESVGMLLTTVRRLVNVGEVLGTVADGDLTKDLTLLSDKDTMGLSLQKMTNNLNNMFEEIHTSTSQVSTGSKQIADGSQSLAQGSTEQAAAVEQLSSSITEIADKTRSNADMAVRAANLANTIKQNAEKGNSQMNSMMEAVKDINEASQSINKVIGVIDSIAFQTNILALNAAVEAARAGQHGKGFAVVAEEVRNLAAKSAEAAKETGSLIANSMEKAELGAKIADETAASLVEIVAGINESSKIVGDIATSSKEQSEGITQINKGIDQVAQVIQQNSATAEESAAASQEMSSQANMLEELISQFKTKESGSSHRAIAAPVSRPKQLAMPAKPAFTDDGDFGKY